MPSRPSARLAAWALATASLTVGCGEQVPAPDRPEPRPRASSSLAESPEPRSAGRAAVKPKAETLTAARGYLSGTGDAVTEGTCGPYRLLSSAPVEYRKICESLAATLDSTYRSRFGVTVPNPPEGVVVIFGSSSAYRDFAVEFGRLPAGYAGFTSVIRGTVAVLAEDVSPNRFATVLAHELTHLVHRRTFGGGLPPWLSEGLADALGDTATGAGFEQLESAAGVGPLATRLRQAVQAGRVGSIVDVIAKTRQDFDRGAVSYDYESSALLVRFLLVDPELGPLFREVLHQLAGAGNCDSNCLLETLALDAEDLEERFRHWLGPSSSARSERRT